MSWLKCDIWTVYNAIREYLDITKSAQLFGLSSRLENKTDNTSMESMVIDGIQIYNRFFKNSFKGTMLTDEGPWSNVTALILNNII